MIRMRKIEIAQRIHHAADIPLEEASAVLNWLLEFLKATLKKGEPISVSNFGVLGVRNKNPRPGRNPKTGEAALVTARRVVTFRASDHLKMEVDAVQKKGPLPRGK